MVPGPVLKSPGLFTNGGGASSETNAQHVIPSAARDLGVESRSKARDPSLSLGMTFAAKRWRLRRGFLRRRHRRVRGAGLDLPVFLRSAFDDVLQVEDRADRFAGDAGDNRAQGDAVL